MPVLAVPPYFDHSRSIICGVLATAHVPHLTAGCLLRSVVPDTAASPIGDRETLRPSAVPSRLPP